MNSGKERKQTGSRLSILPYDFVVIDVETTGLDPYSDEIIELAALKVINHRIEDTFQCLIKPEFPISGYITRINGITNEMVKDSPVIAEVLPNYLEFLGDSILFGHNIRFDINFISEACKQCCLSPLANDYVDMLPLSRKAVKEIPNHKLATLIRAFGIEVSCFHRALADCESTYKCYEYMLNDLSL
jgi:DNA polymerase-3 subunit epsilon